MIFTSIKNFYISLPFSCQAQLLLSGLMSAYVLSQPVLQTIWTEIRLIPKGSNLIRVHIVCFHEKIKSKFCSSELVHVFQFQVTVL